MLHASRKPWVLQTHGGPQGGTHLEAPVECPHLILNPVLLENVHRLEKSEPLHLPGRLMSETRDTTLTLGGVTRESRYQSATPQLCSQTRSLIGLTATH